VRALFSSQVGGATLRRHLLEAVAEAADRALDRKVDLHLMCFAFTDREIAAALAAAAAKRPALTIRILADWSQRIHAHGHQVDRLASLGLSNLRVRYTRDQPYCWDAAAGHMRWSYHASRGLLHHKTLAILVDGRPCRLICGSFNWTSTACTSYEHILVLSQCNAEAVETMARIELEFEALWADGEATLSPHEAHLHYQAILAAYLRDPMLPPFAVVGLERGAGEPLRVLHQDFYPHPPQGERTMRVAPAAVVAFGARGSIHARHRNGAAEVNRSQRLNLRTPAANMKNVPLTLTQLALDTIFRAAPGETLKLAMYGLSQRVPEFGALLDAARRGVHIRVLLDRVVGAAAAVRLRTARDREGLPIQIRTAGRTMHQKYLLNVTSATVLTGTANMTTDASSRHWEHRIRVCEHPELAERFSTDFDIIWERLSPQDPTRGATLA
jgi:phosphatidylserine/phosphatidylglycerophosphate/cardiolipin synthase-like enzyme